MIQFTAALKTINIHKEDDNKLTLIFDNQQIEEVIKIPQEELLKVKIEIIENE